MATARPSLGSILCQRRRTEPAAVALLLEAIALQFNNLTLDEDLWNRVEPASDGL